MRSICQSLNERAVRTVTGAVWKPQTLRRMLMSARIAGQREHNGEIVAVAEWPAIITPAQSARIRALLSDPARRTHKAGRRYLLVRLLRCGRCGETLVSRPTADGTRRYVCAKGPGQSGCGGTYVRADVLEEFVVEAVLHRLDSPEMAAVMNGSTGDPDAERAQAEVESAQAQLDELAAVWAAKEIGMSEWLTARKPIEHRLTLARRQIAGLSRVSVLEGHVGHAPALRERWADLPLTQQTAIVAAVLDHLTVNPARRGLNRFDPDRLTAVWKI